MATFPTLNNATEMTLTRRYNGTLTALEPIAHGDGTMGTTQILHTIKLVVDGAIVDLPVVSGNAIRGMLRDHAMAYMAQVLNLRDLSITALHTLFSGGALAKGSTKKGIDLAMQRDLIQTVPALSLFGAAFGNTITESPLKIGMAIPVCRETAAREMLPDELALHPQAGLSCYDLRDELSMVRRDDAKRPQFQRLLGVPDREKFEQKLLVDAERKAGGAVKDTDEQSQQMRFSVQCFAAGTVFSHQMVLIEATALQELALRSALALWSVHPVIGGLGSRGFGRVKPHYEQLVIGEPAWSAAGALTIGTALEQYAAYLVDHAAQIQSFLEAMA